MQVTDITDIRQSEAWSRYLKMYGWESRQLSCGGILRLTRFLLFSVARIRRAPCLTLNDLKEVDIICKTNRVLYIKISPSISQDLTNLEKFGYRRKGGIDLPPRTAFIDLRLDEASLWKNLTKDCRYSIKKSYGDNNRVEITQNSDDAMVEKYYRVLNERSQRIRFYNPSLCDHLEKIKCFNKESFVSFVCNATGEVLGTKMFLGFNGCVWYMYSGLTKLGEKSCGNYQLMWECIKYFRNIGYRAVDMEGLADDRLKNQTKKWRNYSHYKMQFGGKIVDFPLPYTKYATIFQLTNLINWI